MADINDVIEGLEYCVNAYPMCGDKCPYSHKCMEFPRQIKKDALELLKEQQEEHKRMLSWLSKFCRHIDNGDKWLTDEENLEFFREKMKQQFGWIDT